MNSYDLSTHSVSFQKAASTDEGFEKIVVKNSSGVEQYSRSLVNQRTTLYITDSNTLNIVESAVSKPEPALVIKVASPGACQKAIIQGTNFIGIEDLRAGRKANHSYDLTATQIDVKYVPQSGGDDFEIRPDTSNAYTYSEGNC